MSLLLVVVVLKSRRPELYIKVTRDAETPKTDWKSRYYPTSDEVKATQEWGRSDLVRHLNLEVTANSCCLPIAPSSFADTSPHTFHSCKHCSFLFRTDKRVTGSAQEAWRLTNIMTNHAAAMLSPTTGDGYAALCAVNLRLTRHWLHTTNKSLLCNSRWAKQQPTVIHQVWLYFAVSSILPRVHLSSPRFISKSRPENCETRELLIVDSTWPVWTHATWLICSSTPLHFAFLLLISYFFWLFDCTLISCIDIVATGWTPHLISGCIS